MNSKKFKSMDFVSDHIEGIHTREEDFHEGDLLHRVTKFTHYEEKDILLSEIDLDEFMIDDDLVEEYAKKFIESGTYPKIVYDYVDKSMIDGLHRAAALFKCGQVSISAYVGTERLLNSEYELHEEDEIEDDDNDEDFDTGFGL